MIELSQLEKMLYVYITSLDLSKNNEETLRRACLNARELARSLFKANKIPAIRLKYFTEPEYNLSQPSASFQKVLNNRGVNGDDIFEQPEFLKFLLYFIKGPDLSEYVLKHIRQISASKSSINDKTDAIINWIKDNRNRSLPSNKPNLAEEYFKFCLEIGLDIYGAKRVRNIVTILNA